MQRAPRLPPSSASCCDGWRAPRRACARQPPRLPKADGRRRRAPAGAHHAVMLTRSSELISLKSRLQPTPTPTQPHEVVPRLVQLSSVALPDLEAALGALAKAGAARPKAAAAAAAALEQLAHLAKGRSPAYDFPSLAADGAAPFFLARIQLVGASCPVLCLAALPWQACSCPAPRAAAPP